MKTKKVTTGVAVIGVLAGATGLALVTVPAGAESAPSLPKTSPEALVTSVLKAKPAAFGGTVSAENNLGIPLPNMDQQQNGTYQAKVYSDGKQHYRATMQASDSDQRTVVEDGKALWTYDSAKRQAHKTVIPAGKQHAGGPHAGGLDKAKGQNPAALGRDMVAKLRKSSNLAVDGTAKVAGRDAYELVLTPKPSEKTLVRQVRVAVDSQTRMPLRFELFGNGSTDPAFQVGFSKLDVGAQDPALFEFTPPKGATVTTVDPKRFAGKQHKPKHTMRTAGEGWDTVVTGKMDKSPLQAEGDKSQQQHSGNTPAKLLNRYTKPVHGKFGNGRLFSTPVGTALLTDDGRFAAGLVPEQVLEQALETK